MDLIFDTISDKNVPAKLENNMKRLADLVEKELSDIEKNRENIAKRTLQMPDAMVGVMGGMDKGTARKFLKEIGWSDKEISNLESGKRETHDVSPFTDDTFTFKINPVDQLKAERLLKSKGIQYEMSRNELRNGYVTLNVPNKYVVDDEKYTADTFAKMLTEFGVKVFDGGSENGPRGKHIIKTESKLERIMKKHSRRLLKRHPKTELDYFW